MRPPRSLPTARCFSFETAFSIPVRQSCVSCVPGVPCVSCVSCVPRVSKLCLDPHCYFVSIDFIALVVYNYTCKFFERFVNACRMITVLPSMCTVSAHIMRSAVIKTAYEIFINCFFRSLPGQFHRFGDIESCETSEPILSHRDCRDRTIKSAMGDNNG